MRLKAGVAELADARDSKSRPRKGGEGSSPSSGSEVSYQILLSICHQIVDSQYNIEGAKVYEPD
jgi:hypothetical protein